MDMDTALKRILGIGVAILVVGIGIWVLVFVDEQTDPPYAGDGEAAETGQPGG